jgi:tRNA threonylcarbamoyladenosine biosynthesis protein TsaE
MNTRIYQIFVANAIEDLERVAADIFDLGQHKRVWLINGPMGAGKTSFIAALCRVLKTQEDAKSPTFSLVNQYSYRAADGKECLIHHLDLYRLERLEEAYDIGIDELLDDPKMGYCWVEWPELIAPILPPEAELFRLEIKILPNLKREFVVL